jgi:hypothetical protein
MIEYWWILFLIIIIILIYSIFYKKNNKKRKNKTINTLIKKNGIEKINLGYVLKELPIIAPYYINSL